MRITRMVFGDHTLHLSQDQSLPELMAAAVNAVRSGGGIVQVVQAGDTQPTSVLLSAGVAVIFESRETPDYDDGHEDSEQTMFLGHDDWGLEP